MMSLIVPCYNEEGNVKAFYNEVNNVLGANNIEYEFVFVNDGSNDKTLCRLKEIYNDSKNVQVISFSRNFGKEAAIYAGLKSAKGDLACIIDADLQQRPEVVLEMLDVMKLNDNVDCVTAYQDKRSEGRILSAFKCAFYKIINFMCDVPFVNGASDFRLMRRNMIDAIISMGEYHRFSKGIFSFVGFSTEYIPYLAAERESGTSKWSFRKLFKYAIEGIVSFTTLPLKLSTYVGLISSVLSVIYLLVVVVKKLAFCINVQGWATIVVLLLLLGGMQLFCLGILGEYLSKIYLQVKNRPIYIIKEHMTYGND